MISHKSSKTTMIEMIEDIVGKNTSYGNWSVYSNDTFVVHRRNSANCSNSTSPAPSIQPSSQLCKLSPTYGGYILSIYLVCIICANLIGNSIVLYVSFMSSQMKRKKNTYFIASLALSDIGYAITVIPFLVSMKLHSGMFCHDLSACYFVNICDVLWNVFSVLLLFLIAVDRFVAITKPFKYQDIVTSSVTKASVIGCFLFALLLSIIGLFKWGEKTIVDGSIMSVKIVNGYCRRLDNSYYFGTVFIGFYIIPLVTMTFTYSMVLAVAFKQIKAIKSTTVFIETNQPNEEHKKKSLVNQKWQKEWKATKSVGMVYSCFFMCWFPLFIINMIFLYDPSLLMKLKLSTRNALIYVFIDILPSLNTMMNPLIYSFSNQLFRQSLRIICLRFVNVSGNSRGNMDYSDTNTITEVVSMTSLPPADVDSTTAPRGYVDDNCKPRGYERDRTFSNVINNGMENTAYDT